MADITITPGSTVPIAGFDDIPEHSFCVEEVFEGLHHRHSTHRSPSWGVRRTRSGSSRPGPFRPQLTIERRQGRA